MAKVIKHRLTFHPSGRRGYIEQGKTLLEAAQQLSEELESVCGGKLICGKCAVKIDESSFAECGIEPNKPPLSPPTEEEVELLLQRGLDDKYRLACQARLCGDVVVFVSEATRRAKQIIRKSTMERAIAVKPAIKKYYVELSSPTLDNPIADSELLITELEHSFALKHLSIDYPVIKELSTCLRRSQWKVTVTVWINRQIIKVEPGYVDKSYGLALDIGTTTVAGYLCDLESGKVLVTEGITNPQVAYGEDVMSRITYMTMNPDGLATLNAIIVDTINTLIVSLTGQVGIKPEDISEVTIVGNTTMHHTLLNIRPEYLAKIPFSPTINSSLDIKSRELGIGLGKSANVHILPVKAGFLGADTVGVLIAEEPYNQDEMMLIIDIGTNGELVLGNREKLISASCAMGPALEGAHIKFGMRAALGAIEHIAISKQSLEVRFKVIGNEGWDMPPSPIKVAGICGSGIIDAVAEMVKVGIVDKSGRFNTKIDSNRLVNTNGSPEFVIAWANETSLGLGEDITVSIGDVREVQLAKAAIYAGSRMLMSKLGVNRLDKVVLAGAFGSYISRENALAIGLFPKCKLEKVYSVGNAAGDGARLALINIEKRQEAEDIVKKVEYVELSAEPEFQNLFLDALPLTVR
jgi:uncharacterized 2Fe-2S/4Fe-4S cluster protein (DUF4445 family)